jgi:hypothetical protein
MTEPAWKMLPSSAYEVMPPKDQAQDVRSPFFEKTGFVPRFIKVKLPVPYVVFDSPSCIAF